MNATQVTASSEQGEEEQATDSCPIPPASSLQPQAYWEGRKNVHKSPSTTANCQLPTANCQLPTAYCLLPTAYCLLPTAYCLLPTAYCLLPTAYCLLPT